MGKIDEMLNEHELAEMPCDRHFYTERGYESCHATGREVLFAGAETWNLEYEDSEGNLYYA